MKILILSFLAFFSISPNIVSRDLPTGVARSVVVLEQRTGTFLYQSNQNLQRSVASISKIMTAIIALEELHLETLVIVPEEIKQAVGSMIYVSVGQKISVLDLVYGLMLRSGNDAAITLALAVSTSLEGFVDLMNIKASELQMTNSLFRNPHGLDEFDGGNLSTAKDMALLMAYAMNNETFAQVVATRSHYAQSVKMKWQNKNRLLGLYPYANGGKTGYTKKAKRTLVTSAKYQETQLIVVTLDCGNDFGYHKSLYEFYFSRYETRKLIAKGEYLYGGYQFVLDQDYYFLADKAFWKKTLFVIEIKDGFANLVLYHDDQPTAIARVEAQEAPESGRSKSWWDHIVDFFRGLF